MPKPAPVTNEIPLSERIDQFLQLLKDKNVDPFWTWEKTMLTIINDKRYPLIKSLKERKRLFEQYCQEVSKDKKPELDLTKAYKEHLNKHTSFRTNWEDYSRKHRLDGAFMSLNDAKLRQSLFSEHVEALKEKEKERKYMCSVQVAKMN